MAILVSGGAGYIGSHTCIELLNAGYDVVVADNYYNASPVVLDRVKQITGKDFRFYNADMTKNEDVEIVAGEDESEDVYPLSRDGAFADLEALLRDTLVEALPLQPLCREDCRGLCSQCGIDLNEQPDHHHDVTDIRFAALEGLKARLEGTVGGE